MRVADVFKDLPTLQTERLTLRKLQPDDLKSLFEYGSHPEVTRFTTWDSYESISSAKEFLGNVIARYESRREAPWGISLQTNDKLIGTCGFDDWSIRHSRSEISYALGQPYWGNGYMTEALKRILSFGYDVMRLNRIDARCVLENVRSENVMKKLGMVHEGTLRQHMFMKGKYFDVRVYAMLRQDWDPHKMI